MSGNLVGCRVCSLVHEVDEVAPGYRAECSRCGHPLRQKTPASLKLTFALALSALLLYFPANLFPILRMSMFGRLTENTIFSGVIRFYQDGDYFVAIVVFLASILIPFLKILGLLTLVISTHFRSERGLLFRTKLFVAIERLGPWAMLDVFALAVLISLIKIERIANVIPGKGAAAFVLVILFTILASASFDTQLIWQEEKKIMNAPAKPVLKKRKWPSLIWLIPAACAVITALYARDYFANHGPELTIDFADASGLRVGEAKVLYRGAEVGRVTGISLSENHKRALVHVQFDKREDVFASKGATFWIVRPEVSENGLSGLGTLFSGPYIAAGPGKDEEPVTEIEGLSKPPRPSEDGEKFVLTARRMGHVQEGAAVTYKGIQVGAVQKVELSEEADHLDVSVSVWTRFVPLVRENSKFWISSGIDVEGGIFSGIHMKLDSLKTLTGGGVAFATPDKDMKGPAKKGAVFALEEDPKRDWELWAPRIPISGKRTDSPPKSEPLPAPKREKGK